MFKKVVLLVFISMFSSYALAQYPVTDISDLNVNRVRCGASMSVSSGVFLSQCKIGYTQEQAMQNLPSINEWSLNGPNTVYSCQIDDCPGGLQNAIDTESCKPRFKPNKTPKIIDKNPKCTKLRFEENQGGTQVSYSFWRCCLEATVDSGVFSCTSCPKLIVVEATPRAY